jgi:hypothetical protein
LELFSTEDRNIKLSLLDRGISIDSFCTASGGEYDGIILSPSRSVITALNSSEKLQYAIFHLFNFPNFFGPDNYVLRTGIPPLYGHETYGRIVLKSNGWIITIADTENTGEQIKKLRSSGGYALTHMGKIEKEDGTPFSIKELEDLIACLHYFLSFLLGRWAGFALPIGFNEDNERVFEQWGLGRVAKGRWNGSSWFDDQHSEIISQVFPGFHSIWKNDLWHTPLTHALYWYLGASDRGLGIGVDTGLILAQTALELLAWTYCVQDKKMVSKEAFQKHGLNAADKIRLLASSLKIPKDIPASLSNLHGIKTYVDGMAAITNIRNSLVHPKNQNSPQEYPYSEAYILSMWYIEMILLSICGHTGKYANRLTKNRWAGQVETVPWA